MLASDSPSPTKGNHLGREAWYCLPSKRAMCQGVAAQLPSAPGGACTRALNTNDGLHPNQLKDTIICYKQMFKQCPGQSLQFVGPLVSTVLKVKSQWLGNF